MNYVTVIGKTDNSYSAYLSDLQDCIAVGDTNEETEAPIQEAVEYHLEMLRDNGDPISEPQTKTVVVEV